MKARIIIVIGAILFVGLLSVGCTPTFGNTPVPTVDVDALNGKISELQNQINSLSDKNTADATKIDALNKQVAQYQEEKDKAQALDNSNWVYPAKIGYQDYRAGSPCTYIIRVHNGNDEATTFNLVTDQYLNPSINVAKTPPWIKDWVTYQGVTNDELVLQAKETKDVPATFNEPVDGRFYSVTDKGMNYTQINELTNSQKDIMRNFVTNKSLTVSQIESANWLADVKALQTIGLVCPDNVFEFITAFGEGTGNIQARSAIRWTITMSEFSK